MNSAPIPGIAWDWFDAAEPGPAPGRRSPPAQSAVRQRGGAARAVAPDDAGHPGRRRAPGRSCGRPTILLYAHHDVRPRAGGSCGSTSPSRPWRRSGHLWGRGAADDKAGVMAHVGALRRLFEHRGEEPGLGITVFVEGEERPARPVSRPSWRPTRTSSRSIIVIADSAKLGGRRPP
ncbi:M20/M25/M40 family metallo-hydrolase [Kocuria rhizophila]|nr:M20/M25/M40 family metallo-hydrolase [Kocuria rhizophila]